MLEHSSDCENAYVRTGVCTCTPKLVYAPCTCGATRAKAAYEAGWNAAVKSAMDCVVGVAVESCSPTVTNTLMRAAVAIRKLKKNV